MQNLFISRIRSPAHDFMCFFFPSITKPPYMSNVHHLRPHPTRDSKLPSVCPVRRGETRGGKVAVRNFQARTEFHARSRYIFHANNASILNYLAEIS